MTIKTFIFSPFQENTYLVYDETKEAILIDPGCLYDAEKKTLTKFIEDNDLNLKRLINTLQLILKIKTASLLTAVVQHL